MFKKILTWKFWDTEAPAVLFLVAVAIGFFYPFFFQGEIPFPADTLVGMYHPWRDQIWDGLTAGVPYKNPLITDPVRQQYVWRQMAIQEMKRGELPLWNPYSFSGTPLLANVQSAPLYPLNVFFFILPFVTAWGLLVFLQPLLSSVFLYFYLRFFSVGKIAALVGALAFAYGGFSIAWLEWNTVIQTLLWLPLILLAKEHLLRRWTVRWGLALFIAECSAILAGHLQVLFYVMVVSNVYLLVRIIQKSHRKNVGSWLISFVRIYFPFLLLGIAIFSVTSIFWWPVARFISYSARAVDQSDWNHVGWFILWRHVLQFISPDFFGNPTTNNYWSAWNYGEFIGYVGIVPLLFALYSAVATRRGVVWFFVALTILATVFAFDTPLARLPFLYGIPFLSTSQPTRLIGIVMFGLSILAGFGLDWWLRSRKSTPLIVSISVVALSFIVAWLFAWSTISDIYFGTPITHAVASRNMVLPTGIFLLTAVLILSGIFFKKALRVVALLLLVVTVADLFRFGWKFIPFSPAEWIYPTNPLLTHIQQDPSLFRVMATDGRELIANVSGAYQLQDVSGYDPLYLLSYNQFVGAWTRGKPDVTPGAFDRNLAPEDTESILTDLSGVKYVLTFGPSVSKKLRLVTSEGDTYLYENPQAFPRAFFALSVQKAENKKDEMEQMYELDQQLRSVAVSTQVIPLVSPLRDATDMVRLLAFSANHQTWETTATDQHLLVVTDPWYPTWKVSIDGKEQLLYNVDFLFRGVVIPKGKHRIEFVNHWG